MPLIAILRGEPACNIAPVVRSLIDGGFAALEITMNTPGATEKISAAVACAQNRLAIGAGTVTSLAELDLAQKAGACFIVTPVMRPELIAECVRRGLPIFPGAFTPTEVHQAHRLGATMVKLFPAHRLGPDYVRDLKAPFPSIRLLATGGITPDTQPEYSSAGAEGFGIGSPLFQADRLEAGDWAWLRARAEKFCLAWKQAATPRLARDLTPICIPGTLSNSIGSNELDGL
jgi:2-dehydro-3-deoxyphosphogluconate aldolase/(4S)-4-hydroxy-2-oxoglutarate aldolase